jgi:hypothetical protein
MIDIVPFMDAGPNMVGIRQFWNGGRLSVCIHKAPVLKVCPPKYCFCCPFRSGQNTTFVGKMTNYISSVILRSYNINITCTAFNKSTNHSSNDFHDKEYDGIVCLYQLHTIQNSYKTITLHLCADTLNISNINKPIGDVHWYMLVNV